MGSSAFGASVAAGVASAGAVSVLGASVAAGAGAAASAGLGSVAVRIIAVSHHPTINVDVLFKPKTLSIYGKSLEGGGLILGTVSGLGTSASVLEASVSVLGASAVDSGLAVSVFEASAVAVCKSGT